MNQGLIVRIGYYKGLERGKIRYILEKKIISKEKYCSHCIWVAAVAVIKNPGIDTGFPVITFLPLL
jgi:hypothetical protein